MIQAAFGWGHSHLHEFIAGDGERYGSADPMYDPPDSINSENVRLTTVLRTSTLSYVYDFGDYWDHRITVEKTHPADPLLTLPFSIGGAGATPPEDCGGVPGYADFVRAMADPNDRERAHGRVDRRRHLGSSSVRQHRGRRPSQPDQTLSTIELVKRASAARLPEAPSSDRTWLASQRSNWSTSATQ